MSNANEPAFPVITTDITPSDASVVYSTGGLTKREYFAAMAMQGLLACEATNEDSKEQIVESSVEMADALLDELDGAS